MKFLASGCGIFVIFVLVNLPAASGDDPKADGKDMDRLQGTWRAIKGPGSPKTDERAKNITFVVKGNKMTMHDANPDQKSTKEGTLKLDPKTKAFDWTGEEDAAGRGKVRWMMRLAFCLAHWLVGTCIAGTPVVLSHDLSGRGVNGVVKCGEHRSDAPGAKEKGRPATLPTAPVATTRLLRRRVGALAAAVQPGKAVVPVGFSQRFRRLLQQQVQLVERVLNASHHRLVNLSFHALARGRFGEPLFGAFDHGRLHLPTEQTLKLVEHGMSSCGGTQAAAGLAAADTYKAKQSGGCERNSGQNLEIRRKLRA